MTPLDARTREGVLHGLMLCGVALAARLAFLAWLPSGTYSADVDHWLEVDRVLSAGGNPYNLTEHLNWPPLWMQTVFAVGRLARASNLQFVTVLRAVLITVELSSILLAYGLLRRVASPRRALWLVIGAGALNPVAILLICQHCNFDIFIAVFVLLTVICVSRFAERGDPVDWLWACVFIGLGTLAKTVPLVLVPLLAFHVHRLRWSERLLGVLLVLGPVTLGMSVIYALGPAQISANVLHYRSYPGWFGISGLMQLGGVYDWGAVYRRCFAVSFLIVVMGLIVVAVRRRRTSVEERVLLTLVLLAAVPGLGPGYSPQYITWFLMLLPIALAVTSSRWLRTAIPAFLAIAAATYVIEYAMFTSHGSFWVKLHPTPEILETSARWSTQAGQTRIRLPLFLGWLWLLAALSARLLQSMRGGEDSGHRTGRITGTTERSISRPPASSDAP